MVQLIFVLWWHALTISTISDCVLDLIRLLDSCAEKYIIYAFRRLSKYAQHRFRPWRMSAIADHNTWGMMGIPVLCILLTDSKRHYE